ncbi:uncharacterized protein LOC123706030 [Colias croceus]|uniref:uncharacterized protein LOC123706030 n=1 Tax=Colias crocea TaxID=72248 RepID=UPI001E27F76F|nr:uncharacterized protein LOC123706030 [Colias croceus]
MFKNYKDIRDVVSLLVYCPYERAYLLSKESNGEYWIPSCKTDKSCWKTTAHKLHFELFGMDSSAQCHPLRVYKIWLPNHTLTCVYHAVYKVAIKSDVKKRVKHRAGIRNRLQWFTMVELERLRAHTNLRSPELAIFAQMAVGDVLPKDLDVLEFEPGILVEICEDNILLGVEVAAGAVALASPHCQLLQAANYLKEDQIRLYTEFILLVYPALYMSPYIFTQFMQDLGWQKSQCSNLFRAADISGRGGLSFLDLMLWSAALEPFTQHNGSPAELRCRYIFRYFDSNRDQKLEYQEFKELMSAARAARELPVDSLSVARDTDVCLRQLGLQPNSQLPIAEFLRAVSELRIRGTSALLRSPKSTAGYLIDLHERDREMAVATASKIINDHVCVPDASSHAVELSSITSVRRKDYSLANCVVKLQKKMPPEMQQLTSFDEETITSSTAHLISSSVNSMDFLGANSTPVEVFASIHYFSLHFDKTSHRRVSGGGSTTATKSAFSWLSPDEEVALGSLLLKMAEAVRAICSYEPRLLRLSSPVYAIGDLHGNLPALLAMESSLWPTGTALVPARLLFLGDYVDRGAFGTELLAYLFAAKLQRPTGVYLIRGNHEARDIQKMFSFHTECLTKYGEVEGTKIWSAINQVFDVLPLAAVVDDKVFCCHGGIPPPWVCPLISAIDKVPVPLPKPAEQSSIAWELLWNDPIRNSKITASQALELAANEGFAVNSRRGTAHVFSSGALQRFLLANQLSHVLRAHELHQNGFMCQFNGRLVSVFSSSHYCGGNNDSGVVLLEDGKLRLIKVTSEL